MSIILFPVDRQTADIERCARALLSKNAKAAEKYWRTECNRLYGRLQAIGMTDSEARAEVDRFARAVYREFENRIPDRDHGRGPGAA